MKRIKLEHSIKRSENVRRDTTTEILQMLNIDYGTNFEATPMTNATKAYGSYEGISETALAELAKEMNARFNEPEKESRLFVKHKREYDPNIKMMDLDWTKLIDFNEIDEKAYEDRIRALAYSINPIKGTIRTDAT